jgi:hypothetical protein
VTSTAEPAGPPARRPGWRDDLGGRAAARTPNLLGLAFWVVLPIASVLLLALGIDSILRHVNNIPAGVRGTYVVTSHDCQGQVCLTAGTFTSTDGRLVETDLLGDYRWQLGEKHRAVYNGNAVDVIPLPARWNPTAAIVGIAGVLAFLTIWTWCLLRGRGRRAAGAGGVPN